MDHAADRCIKYGVGELLPRDLQFRTPLREQRLTIARFIERVFVPCFGDLISGIRRVEVGLRQKTLLKREPRPFQAGPRRVHFSPGLLYDREILDIYAGVGSFRRKPDTDSRLLQGGIGLPDSKFEVRRIQTRDWLAFFNGTTQIDGYIRKPTGYLEAKYDLLVCGQSAGHDDELIDSLLYSEGGLNLSRWG